MQKNSIYSIYLTFLFISLGLSQTPPVKEQDPKEKKLTQTINGNSEDILINSNKQPLTPPQLRALESLRNQEPPGAGTLGPSIPGLEIWDNGILYACESRIGKDVHRIVKGKGLEVLTAPPQGRFGDFCHGHAYFWNKESKGNKKILRFLRDSDGKTLESLGTFEESHFLVDYKVLDNGRFLLLFGLIPLKVGEEFSFLIKAKPNERGEWEPEEALNLDLDIFDHSKMKLLPNNPLGWIKEGKQIIFHDLIETKLQRVGDFLLMPLLATGSILIFKAETGSYTGKVTLFPSVENLENRGKPLERAILCYRPTPDGNLILATRTEDAVLNSRSVFQDGIRFTGMDSETYLKKLMEVQTKALEAFPEIVWWKFEPVNRVFTRIPAPEWMPDKFNNFNSLRDFTFWVDSEGRVVQRFDSLNKSSGKEAETPKKQIKPVLSGNQKIDVKTE